MSRPLSVRSVAHGDGRMQLALLVLALHFFESIALCDLKIILDHFVSKKRLEKHDVALMKC